MSRYGVIVAGMHRSGTSATAGALARLGFETGSKLLAPGEDNPTGYWEHEDAVRIHEALLDGLNRRWDDIRPLPADWRNAAATTTAAAEISAFMAREFGGVDRWVIKDPRICRFLPLWLEQMKTAEVRPVMLLVVRDPREVAASIKVRNGWDASISHLLWIRHILEAVCASGDVPRAVISYPALLQDPDAALARALRKLEVDIPAGDARPLAGFVDPSARHHISLDDGQGASPWLQLALQVHDLLCRIESGHDAWSEFPSFHRNLDRMWGEREPLLSPLAAMAHSYAARASSLQQERDSLGSSLTAQVRWSEEAAARIESLQADRDRSRSDLVAQLKWSDEAAARIEMLQVENSQVRSDLAAQLKWSDEAAARIESLLAERDSVRSEFIAQVRWSEEAVARIESLQVERDTLSSDLRAQVRWSEDAVKRMESLRAERDRLSNELADCDQVRTSAVARAAILEQELAVAIAGLRSKDRELEALKERITELDAGIAEQRARLHQAVADTDEARAALASAHQMLVEARADVQRITATLSWRVTRPLRALRSLFPSE